MTGQCSIALIGLAVMGENLALNIAGKGHPIAVYNRTAAKTRAFLAGRARGLPVRGAETLEDLAAMLTKPRKILLMVKAGQAVDDTLAALRPHLEPGDIVMDGGNSHYADTRRRHAALGVDGIHFLGVGVSGGEEGALTGPSIMPGGDRAAYDAVAPVLTSVAALAAGRPCCAWIGPDGAGHYVKMVHNGIEYGDMQLIAEAYAIMKDLLGLDPAAMQHAFASWNQGRLESYLIEITADILGRRDEFTGRPLVDLVLDKAGQKGTGKWTSQDALGLGVPVPTITAAVYARCLSAYKDERLAAARILAGPRAARPGDSAALLAALESALYAAKICSYAQGFALLRAAAHEYGWDLDYGRIALLWRGGCIIRARFLESIAAAYDRDANLPNLLTDPFFADALAGCQAGWRETVAACQTAGVAVPAFAASLAYYDGYRSAVLPANLIQAQRDYFGAHTYERIDRPGTYHTDWLGADRP
jgi:6-phosphogluconate dehydrogenase